MSDTLALLLALSVPLSAGQAQADSSDAQVARYLSADVRLLSGRFLDGATTLADWNQRRPRLHQEYLDMLGLWPMPERTPLRPTITGTVTRGGVLIDLIHFQSVPGLYVTGNLYRPANSTGRLPTILYVCGHSGRGRDGNKTAFQDHGMWFARNGYICLVIDTLQLGEIAGIHHGTYNQNRWWWHSAGYTSAGVECWNGVRAIDYLVSREDVDRARIGVTGISGGGAATIWIAAADERVKVAVPVSGMSDLESYVSNKVINGHCDCMFLYNDHRWEWTTIAALIAPRPMLFANSDNDRIFPMDGNRRIIERLRQAYKLHGKAELVDDYVSKGGHDYRPDLRLAVFKWINKHLENDKQKLSDADDKPLPGKQLRVFPEDKDIPKDALNARIDETFVPRAKVKLPQDKEFAAWQKTLLAELRGRAFRPFPAEGKWLAPKQVTVDANWETYRTDGEVPCLLSAKNLGKGVSEVVGGTLIVVDEADAKAAVPEWGAGLVAGPVRVVVPRGLGANAWERKSPPNYVARAHRLLGRTVDQGRVYEIAAIARMLKKDGSGWRVVGKGQAGVLAAYAALFEPAITEVVAVEPTSSHKEGPHFPGVLRTLDVPETLGLLAPRKLTLVAAHDKAFERTEAIYKSAGAATKLTRQ